MALRDQDGNYLTPHGVGAFAYEYDWFSGSQIGIMIGDVLIDGAVALSFNSEQSKTPVYGYANQYYTFTADGHILVQGTLTVAFKEAGYLMWPMQRFQEKAAIVNSLAGDPEGLSLFRSELSNSPRYSVDEDGHKINYYNPEVSGYSLMDAAREAEKKLVMEGNVEQLFDSRESPRVMHNFWRDLGHLPDNQFEDWAETFEDAIWFGADKSNPTVRDKLFSNNIDNKTQISQESVLRHRRIDQYPEIDLWIVYGDMSRQPSNHTVKKILDLSFTGQSQTIEISGQPIYEQYNFIARNLV